MRNEYKNAVMSPGLGFGLIYLPAVVCVGYYFETKRSLATGIAVCGSGFGTFVFAPLATMLVREYDWWGANLILAGLILNCAVRRESGTGGAPGARDVGHPPRSDVLC